MTAGSGWPSIGTLINPRGRGQRLISWLLVLAIVLAMAVQTPFLWQDAVARTALYACWALLLLILVLTTRVAANRTLIWVGACLLMFDIFCVVGQLLLGRPYLSSSLLRAVNLAVMLLFIGYLLSRRLNRDEMLPAALVYVMLAIGLVAYVYLRYFYNVDTPLDGYAYPGKNSLGVIAVSAVIMVLALARYGRIHWILAGGISVLLLWSVFLVQNRASLVALVVILGWEIARRGPKTALRALVPGVVLLLLLIQVPAVAEYLRATLLLDRLQDGGLDNWSSGRVALASAGWQAFRGSPLVGVGDFYVENFQLSALVQYGVLGTIPLVGLLLVPLGSSVIRVDHGDWISSAVPYLCLLMLVVSVFEELAPFGPGVRSLFSWLLVGYASACTQDRQAAPRGAGSQRVAPVEAGGVDGPSLLVTDPELSKMSRRAST